MKTVIFEVNSEKEVSARFLRAWKTGIPEAVAHYSFATPALMPALLTEKRRQLLAALCGAGALSVEQIAQRTQQDCDGVRSDLNAMASAGIVNLTRSGKVIFPFNAFEVNSLSHAA